MVKKISFLFIYFFVFIIAFVYFLPKDNLFYLAQKELKKQSVAFEKEQVVQKPFSLLIQNPSISYQGIVIAKVAQIDIIPFILYNKISFETLRVSSKISKLLPPVAKDFIPQVVDELDIKYAIYNPLNITLKGVYKSGGIDIEYNLYKKIAFLEAKTKLGELKGNINQNTHMAVFILKPSKLAKTKYRTVLYRFRKLKDGSYKYETRF
jgi:hypothetical protein